MTSGMFNGVSEALIIIGVIAGLAIAGFIWLAVWIFSHLQINWV
ncbi:hypothetical protein [Sporomusa sphaeroides]|nr:hypothetical protein [Sporomusa sphaeroides]